MAGGVALGVWQLSRAAGKISAARALETQAALPVLEGSLVAKLQSESTAQDERTSAKSVNTSTLEHRRVVLRGHWLSGHTVYLDNRQMDDRVGFYVVTPLQLDLGNGGQRGPTVLVQRGWIPRNFEDRSRLEPVTTPDTLVEVTGRVESTLSRTFAFAGSDEEKGSSPIRQNLSWRDFSTAAGLNVVPFVVIETGSPSEGLKRDWPAADLGVQRHYGYAFQWFALAALALFLYLFLGVVPFIRRRGPLTASNPPNSSS
jgi:surfeit locus 1 family protein